MTKFEIFTLVLAIVGIIGTFIGTGISIYQYAVIKEGKKRKREFQHLLAGINSSASMKQLSWQNQLNQFPPPKTEEDMSLFRLHMKARDDFTDIANLTVALEGTIDTEGSAIDAMMEKNLKKVKMFKEYQEANLQDSIRNSDDTLKLKEER